jgi:hypothetical protein
MARYLDRSAALALLVLGSSPILAHSWYPVSCCSDKDCHPVVEEEGETVTESEDGWRLWDGRTVGLPHAGDPGVMLIQPWSGRQLGSR